MYVRVHICVYTNVSKCADVCICMHACMYVYTTLSLSLSLSLSVYGCGCTCAEVTTVVDKLSVVRI